MVVIRTHPKGRISMQWIKGTYKMIQAIDFLNGLCYIIYTFPPFFRGGVRGGSAASASLIGWDSKKNLQYINWEY